jgi:cytochrome P450
LNVILNLVNPYQSPTRFWMGPRLVVAVKDPNQLQVLTTPSNPPKNFTFVSDRLAVFEDHNQRIFLPVLGALPRQGFVHVVRFAHQHPLRHFVITKIQGITHKTHRKLLQPLFSQRMIEGYCHLFQKHAAKFVERMRPHAGGPEFDVMLYLQNSAFENTMGVVSLVTTVVLIGLF